MKRYLGLFVMLMITAQSVTAQPAKTFAYGPDPAQRVDGYLKEASENAPAIIMLHGGAWRFGDKSNRGVWQNKVAHWGAQGYAFFSVNTRLLPQAGPVTQANDLAAAMAYIQQNADEFGIDADRIVLMGHSAGAHVAALVATDQQLQSTASLAPWQGTVVLDTAALDLVRVMEDNPVRLYRRAFGDDPSAWTQASPLTHLDARDGPFLIVCAAGRRTPCPAANRFATAADKVGLAAQVLPQDLSHRAINTNLGKDTEYTAQVDAWMDDLNR